MDITRAILEHQIRTANGQAEADFVLKNATFINVFTEKLETADIAIADGIITGIGTYSAGTEIDLTGKILCPGLLDGHIHLESCMAAPSESERAMLAHGTVAVVTDPHEITNVAGTEGLDYMLEMTKNLHMDVYFMLPSCVPAAPMDESGAVVLAADLKKYYENPRVLGLAEMMDAYDTVRVESAIMEKLIDTHQAGKMIDGHAPGLNGKELEAYITAGVGSDHECSDIEDAMHKLSRGQWIMLREGTAARNLEALMPLFQEPYAKRTMLVTDDRHSEDLLQDGHIDLIIRKAVAMGADPIKAVIMGSLHTAEYFGLKRQGAIAPGYWADMIAVDNLQDFQVEKVWKKGALVAEHGICLLKRDIKERKVSDKYPKVYQSFHMDQLQESDFAVDFIAEKSSKGQDHHDTGNNIERETLIQRVIQLQPRQLLTCLVETLMSQEAKEHGGVDISRDILKLAVFERHHHTGHHSVGFIQGYGLKNGAIACSIAHDSHNLIVVGVKDADMAAAANAVIHNGGGIAIAVDGAVVEEQPLPIGGIMSLQPIEQVAHENLLLKKKARELGVSEEIDPFMTLAFVSLPVIPQVRLNTCGLIDVTQQRILDVLSKS